MASLRSALPIAILLSLRQIFLRSCQSSWSVHESSVAVQKAAYLDNHLLCRIVIHCCRMQLSCGAIQSNCEHRTRRAHDGRTNTEIAEHDWRFAVRGLQRTYPAPSGFGRCLIEHCPSVPHDCNPRRYNVFERSLGGLLELASQDSNRSLGRFCLYAVHGGRRCPIPAKFPVRPGASFPGESISRRQ